MKRIILLIVSIFISNYSLAFSETELISLLQQPSQLQGKFVQHRYLKNLEQPITTSGTFNLFAKQGLLWNMEKPFSTQLKVTPDGIQQWNGTQWINNNNIAQKEQITLFLGLLSGDIAPLKSQFTLNLTGTAKQWQLTLLPKTLIMQQIFQQIQIKGNQYVTEINLQESQGDNTQLLFENIMAN